MKSTLWQPLGAVVALMAMIGTAQAQIAVAPGAVPGNGIRPGPAGPAMGGLGGGIAPVAGGGYALATAPAGNPYTSTGSLGMSPYGGFSLSTVPFTGGFIPPYALPYNDFFLSRLDPYSGYLQGLAAVTSATGQYYRDVQQARITRYQANMAGLDYARARIRWEREYETGRIRGYRDELEGEKRTALESARRNAPNADIWSGKALNELLRSIRSASSLSRGPNLPLDEDVLRHINLTNKSRSGNAGMLKSGGKLTWPSCLKDKNFDEERERISRHLEAAVKSIKDGNVPDNSTLKDLSSDFRAMEQKLFDSTATLSPGEFMVGKRYMSQLRDALAALRDPGAKNYLDNTWNARGRTVAELVDYMRREGLEFNAATPGDEAAYTSLYDTLRRFERGLMVGGTP